MESGGAEGEGGEEEQRLRGLPLLASSSCGASLERVEWWWLLLCSRACMTEFETEMEMKEERPEEAAGHGHMGKSATAATES